MRYDTIKDKFQLSNEQIDLIHEILENIEYDHEDIHIAIMLAKQELTMNILLSTLVSFAYYEEGELDEEYAETLFTSIKYIIESYKDMDSLIDENGEVKIPLTDLA